MTLDKQKFLAKIHKLSEKGKAEGGRLNVDDINDEFKDDDLSPDEFEEIFKFLETAGVSVDTS